MVEKLERDEHNFNIVSNQVRLKYNDIEDLRVCDFVTKHTLFFFRNLQIDTSFLAKSVTDWPADNSYIKAKNFVKKIHVVNDVAERGIALVKTVLNDYKGEREDDFQGRLLTVFYNRKDDILTQ